MQNGNLMEELSIKFALRIIKLYKYLCEEKKEFIMSKQVYRSGTSIGANIAESKTAQSDADFINKLSIALKEANETEYWLVLLHESGTLSDEEFQSIENDINTIIGTLIIIIKKKKGLN
jgi:four helix bundle protein